MATYIQLDQAAKEVGKSEITIRRLVKAAKITHRKEKTLTGFIYLVDPEEILKFYQSGNSDEGRVIEPEEQSPETDPSEEPIARQIRVAVTGESGNLSEYWQKRAETYEDRYYRELEEQAKLREELGAWRGRAEQAQNMLVKLLPAPEKPQPPAPPVKHHGKEEASVPMWVLAVMLGVSAIVLVLGAVAAYFVIR
jgi:hypothetical protein